VPKNVIVRAGASVRLGQPDDVGIGTQGDRDRLPIAARLFADLATGARLSVSRATIVGRMPRRGEAAIWKRYSGPPLPADPEDQRQMLEAYRVQRRDVEDIINSVLGRDPEQIRPFSLSWDPLIKLLDRNGINLGEEQLIATPFAFEFSDGLLVELAPVADGS
jgi:hypothetical protein